MKQINVVKTTSVTETLLNIPYGETVCCPNSVINSQVLRVTADRMKRKNRALFVLSTTKDGIIVTRK